MTESQPNLQLTATKITKKCVCVCVCGGGGGGGSSTFARFLFFVINLKE